MLTAASDETQTCSSAPRRSGRLCDSGRLLPQLDPHLIATHPKIFVGHSDLTFILNDAVQRAELVVFHGPMVTRFSAQPAAVGQLLNLLTGERIGWHQTAAAVVQPGM